MSDSISNETPEQTWAGLQDASDTILVDVRTRAEWAFVGVPDLRSLNKEPLLVEWKEFPTMAVNESFSSQILDALSGETPTKIYFLCRSGVRSVSAAVTMAEVFATQNKHVECVNVLEGFEGDLDPSGHRGNINGWKSRGLAWGQS
ncbi:sulfurtransferase [Amylibacter marinus]|uniref:Sulfurtransferase n=1 Tax=Amylibacter marinus TaxID=1475483 RepID=A0ABQ5VW46_9RHOB|nr:rhodanese-like domain-containing protein [Amylibacter marinus]GLQ35671.1 sulfurtransferase [Amylibacter marinus]